MLLSQTYKEIIDSLFLNFKNDGIIMDNSLSELSIEKFEILNNVNIPEDLKYFLLKGNGFVSDQMYLMSRFWPLREYVAVVEYFDNIIIHEKNESKLVSDKKMVDIDGAWLLDRSKNFYLFCDYNINGNYWAIDLIPNEAAENEILSINDLSNSYRVVANNFTEFVKIFISRSPEELL